VKLVIHGVPELREARLRLHPSRPDRGDRVIPLERDGDKLIVRLSSGDVEGMQEGQAARLKDLLNFKLTSREPLEAEFTGFEVSNVPKIQWVSAGAVEAEVLRPDGSRDQGLAEPEVSGLEPGEVVQFERYGFVRLEKVKPKVEAVFTHR